MKKGDLVQVSDYQAYADWLAINRPTSAAFSRMARMTGKIVDMNNDLASVEFVGLYAPNIPIRFLRQVDSYPVSTMKTRPCVKCGGVMNRIGESMQSPYGFVQLFAHYRCPDCQHQTEFSLSQDQVEEILYERYEDKRE